ncbi:MAG: SecY-interacting protein [Pseudomonadales bacterium]
MVPEPSGADVGAALDAFVERYVAACPRLTEPFDAAWRSPCENGEPYLDDTGERRVPWQPLRRHGPADDFAGLERALEFAIHPDIKDYYGRYWSGGLEAEADDGHVSLLQLWNADDADRLVENLIGHALAKRRARAPFTVFFACTEPDSELFLSVDNGSGAVVLEAPGRRPLRPVADSLADFLSRLRPAPPPQQTAVE